MMQPNLKPEAVEVLRQLVDHSRELSKALAKIVNQPSREFKEHPGGEYIDRSQAMDHVIAIRDAHYRLADAARQAIVALGVKAQAPVPDWVPVSESWRWNIERDGDALLVCFNQHDKGQPCEMVRYVPERAAGVKACGSNGTADCQSTAAEHRCAACPHGVKACPPGHCRTPSAPCRGVCIQTIQPRDTADVPVPVGVKEVPPCR